MRTVFIYFAVLSCLILSCKPERAGKDGKEELGKLIIAYYETLSKADSNGLADLTAPNFVMFDDGKVYSNQAALEMVRSLPPFKASFRLQNVHAHIGKQNASMYYVREAQFTIGDSTHAPSSYLESSTFMKVGDEWKIRFIHSTGARSN